MTMIPQMRRMLVLFCLLSTTCAPPRASTEGRWFGTSTPNPPALGCAPSRASLIVSGTEALFTPDEGTWTLRGAVGADGAVQAERSVVGANKQAFATRFEARRVGQDGPELRGTYTTPRCRFDVSLSKP